jgi:hypothetical protein
MHNVVAAEGHATILLILSHRERTGVTVRWPLHRPVRCKATVTNAQFFLTVTHRDAHGPDAERQRRCGLLHRNRPGACIVFGDYA